MTTILLILVIITGISAVGIVIELIGSKKCPSREDLKNVVLGRVDQNSHKAKRIKAHLGICSSCRNSVQELL